MFITINGCKLFFDVYGSKLRVTKDAVQEKPTLIVLHGGHGFADHTLYVEFWSQFSDLVQVILLDQRGGGRSDHRDSTEWNLNHWGKDVYLFCEALGIKNPIIAGVSMGGHVMCEYIRHYPEHPGGLIFCNTEAQMVLDDICEEMRKKGGDKVAEITRRQYTNPTPESAADYTKYCIPYYAKNAYSPVELNRCIKNIPVFNHYIKNEVLKLNYLDDMQKIKCPTLFMVGGDSPVHLPKFAKAMADRMDKKFVNMKVFEGAGAAVYKDSPEEAFLVVKAFLEKYAEHQ
jgi:pimeloyl-ACP methyl ester carboxylesterase